MTIAVRNGAVIDVARTCQHVKDDVRGFFFVKQKTAYEIRPCDWSSDVCSSDLPGPGLEPRLGTWSGGLSGPALKPVALAAVYACWRATRMPIVGMGGVMSGRDVLEFIAAGAEDVALGTVLFRDPEAPQRVRTALAAEVASLGVADVDDVRGVALEGGLSARLSLTR